jgi:hypothetical protein
MTNAEAGVPANGSRPCLRPNTRGRRLAGALALGLSLAGVIAGCSSPAPDATETVTTDAPPGQSGDSWSEEDYASVQPEPMPTVEVATDRSSWTVGGVLALGATGVAVTWTLARRRNKRRLRGASNF